MHGIITTLAVLVILLGSYGIRFVADNIKPPEVKMDITYVNTMTRPMEMCWIGTITDATLTPGPCQMFAPGQEMLFHAFGWHLHQFRANATEDQPSLYHVMVNLPNMQDSKYFVKDGMATFGAFDFEWIYRTFVRANMHPYYPVRWVNHNRETVRPILFFLLVLCAYFDYRWSGGSSRTTTTTTTTGSTTTTANNSKGNNSKAVVGNSAVCATDGSKSQAPTPILRQQQQAAQASAPSTTVAKDPTWPANSSSSNTNLTSATKRNTAANQDERSTTSSSGSSIKEGTTSSSQQQQQQQTIVLKDAPVPARATKGWLARLWAWCEIPNFVITTNDYRKASAFILMLTAHCARCFLPKNLWLRVPSRAHAMPTFFFLNGYGCGGGMMRALTATSVSKRNNALKLLAGALFCYIIAGPNRRAEGTVLINHTLMELLLSHVMLGKLNIGFIGHACINAFLTLINPLYGDGLCIDGGTPPLLFAMAGQLRATGHQRLCWMYLVTGAVTSALMSLRIEYIENAQRTGNWDAVRYPAIVATMLLIPEIISLATLSRTSVAVSKWRVCKAVQWMCRYISTHSLAFYLGHCVLIEAGAIYMYGYGFKKPFFL